MYQKIRYVNLKVPLLECLKRYSLRNAIKKYAIYFLLHFQGLRLKCETFNAAKYNFIEKLHLKYNN